ncbi:LON peptidase N-terminal domain and RING finger protein 1-like [Corticium candelabrum]|uniref:LON peptidase N-terminal domain and RING finger protein 1-like n=1 Tax=Corticium candelabrum TaxID=121492 RepID=UPI002E263D98|nr:LON peptidase N-terminal domain and RING finger protein 1-like [Corticium candelabrum]
MTSANHHLVQIPIILSRTAAFPGVTYRWKIREKRTIQQCLESGSSQFGVCLVRPLVYNEPFADVGTVVTIQNQVMQESGDLLIDAIGDRRFSVVKREATSEFFTAKVLFLCDNNDICLLHAQDLQEIRHVVYDNTIQWFRSLHELLKENLTWSHGSLPRIDDEISVSRLLADGPVWVWWAFAVLQKPEISLAALSSTNLKERLELLQKQLKVQMSLDS